MSLPDQFEYLTKARPKGASAYAFSLRQNIRAFWNGQRDFDQFLETLNDTIRIHFELAWQAGASECGITPSERTPEESAKLNELIFNQQDFTFNFAEFVEANVRSQGGLLRTSFNRLPPWVNRWNETKAIAQQMACKNQKFVWRLGATEKHCKTCLKLNGRIMRGDKWQELDIWPQDTRPGKLDCNGFNCDCKLLPTNKRATPGKLPRL